MKRRVAVTGLGALTPLGNDVQSSWKSLLEGRSGIDFITHFDAKGLKTKIAGEIKGFDPLQYMDPKSAKRTDLFIQYALAATQMAFDDAGIRMEDEDASRVGVIVGTGIGGISQTEQAQTRLLKDGPGRVSPLFVVSMISNMAAGHIALSTGAKGFSTCIVTACASGTHAVGDAFKVIQRADADIMIAGGTEAALTPLVVGGLQSMKATSTRDVDPASACCPFDIERDGMVPAEGSGFLILEEWEHAIARGAKIRAEIIEYGLIGLAVGGKKGAVIVGGMAHMVEWAKNLATAFDMAGKGIIDFSEIATANFKELEELISRNGRGTYTGQINANTPGYDAVYKPQTNVDLPVSSTDQSVASTLTSGAQSADDYAQAIKEAAQETLVFNEIVNSMNGMEGGNQWQAMQDSLTNGVNDYADALIEAEQETQKFNQIVSEMNGFDASINQWQRMGNVLSESQDEMLNSTNAWSNSMANAFSGWATSYSNTLNEMLWNSELTFDGILESFMKMITEMIIQKALLAMMDAAFGGDGGWRRFQRSRSKPW